MANPTNYRADGVTVFHFYVDLGADYEGQAVFTECSALEIDTKVEPYEEGGRNDHTHKLPGRSTVSDITLKQGIVMGQNNLLWAWYLKTLQGKIERRNITITVVDQEGETVQSWSLIEAFPIKWVGPSFNAGSSTMAIQSLTFTHKGVDFTNTR